EDSHKQTYYRRNLDNVVDYVTKNTNDEHHGDGDNYRFWRKYLRRKHPSVQTLRHFFAEAAQEFTVPVVILEAIAQVETNWTQIGPSIDQGWGIMHLVQNNYADTLGEAAALLDIEPQVLKNEAKQNIRAAAALLAQYAGENRHQLTQLEDWFEAVKQFTGLINNELREMQAVRYYQIIKTGSQSHTLWGETLRLESHPNVSLTQERISHARRNQRSTDYAPAISNLTTCNYSERSSRTIDTWVNHWIGEGTYAGAISWFQNCNAKVSAHFIVRASDGEITQLVKVKDIAWHAGVWSYNKRSIGVEHEVTVTNPDTWTTQMLEASANMARYFTDKYNIPRVRSTTPGILGHNEIKSTACPGTLPWDRWMNYLNNHENYAWHGNGSIISYHGRLLPKNAGVDWPYGITKDVVQLHQSADKPVGFFQWQINEDGCNRLILDAPFLSPSEKKVDITMGRWDSREYDVTFSNITLPFVLGASNTPFTLSNGDWFVVKIAFLNPLNEETRLGAICTDDTPTDAAYISGSGNVMADGYEWNGNASIISHLFRNLHDYAVDSIDWPYGAFRDMTVAASKKPMVFFQWQNDALCPQLTLDAYDLSDSEKQVDVYVKLWDAPNDDAREYYNQTLPLTIDSIRPTKEGSWNVIQIKFRNAISGGAQIDATCPGF
ncbi:peptidoglycan recognition family protein, partial [Candidatus Marithioploca araucensis]|nr:peptidoglycan recognition family protein [Candidatus Marithioploca araucensis]